MVSSRKSARFAWLGSLLLATLLPFAAYSSDPESGADFADGLSGGPDFWAVQGIAADDHLNLRSGPSIRHEVLGTAPDGTLLRNLGCAMEGDARWCRVRTLDDPPVEGWASGRYLVESAGPAGGAREVVVQSDDPDAPDLYVRPTGEIEVNFKAGCGALYEASGQRITAGSSCSDDQLNAAQRAVESYRRSAAEDD